MKWLICFVLGIRPRLQNIEFKIAHEDAQKEIQHLKDLATGWEGAYKTFCHSNLEAQTNHMWSP